MGTPLLQVLADSIYARSQTWLEKILKSISGIHLSAFGITFDAEEKGTAYQYQILLLKILDELKKRNMWVLVTIDEVKDTPEIREFASVYQLLLRHECNICLLMAGLPENVSELQNDDVLTFLLRAGRITLKPIDLWMIRESYAKAFAGHREITDENLTRISRMTRGYAYAFQLLGYYLWQESEGKIDLQIIEQAEKSYRADLYLNSYLKIYQGLTGVEREFLMAMADYGEEEVPFGSIVAAMGKSKSYVSVYRLRLLDTQVIETSRHGYVRFTLPLFGQFMLDAKELMV